MLAAPRGRSYYAPHFAGAPGAPFISSQTMFEFLRTKLKDSIFSKIFLTLLALSFGVWGVGDFIGAGGLDPTIAVKVGKTSIQTDEFQRRFTQEMERFKRTVGPEAAQEESMKQSVLNGLIQDITRTATISAAAHDMNVV